MSKISVLKTSPGKVIEDYSRLMDLAEYKKYVKKNKKTILKLNLSWSLYFPSCSTEPWQLEGVLKKMIKDKYKNIIPVENQTVVTHPWKGAYGNKWLPVLKKYKQEFIPLTDVKWKEYKPKQKMTAMNEVFGDKVYIPKIFFDSNVIHLPTVKTHGHTVTTGAMKNAFGGLIPKFRHHAHKKIHDILVDLLIIQKEVHKGIFSVMDGTVAGDGAGPRTMNPVLANLILAGEDQVAIDAVSAKIMGFDPMKIDYIKKAHDLGLGIGDVDQIDVVGGDIKKINLKFKTTKSPVIFFDQVLRRRIGKIFPPLEKILFHSPLFKIPIFLSGFYHDRLWYPTIGKSKIKSFNKTNWGKLWEKYQFGEKVNKEVSNEWGVY